MKSLTPVAKKHTQVETNFPIAAKQYETQRSGNILQSTNGGTKNPKF